MKKLVLLFVLVVSLVKAQGDDQNHRKYWYYRTRLVNDLLKVGTEQGDCIPFSERGLSYNGVIPAIAMKCGDGTSKLGVYIGVLATEWKLLKMNGQNTDKVEHELACALYALDRLDDNAEAAYGGTSSRNGFLVRDDIPSDYVANNYAHFNYYNTSNLSYFINLSGTILNPPPAYPGAAVYCAQSGPHGYCGVGEITDNPVPTLNNYDDYQYPPKNYLTDRGFCSNIGNGVFLTESDYYSGNHPDGGDAISQDQLYDIIMGLALVSKFVSPVAWDKGGIYGPAVVFDGAGQKYLTAEARTIMARITNYVKDSQGASGIAIPWNIYNPVLNTIVDYGGHQSAGEMMPWSYAFARGACYIADPVGNEMPEPAPALPLNCSNFDDQLGLDNSIGYSNWTVFESVEGNVHPGYSDAQFYANLAAVCNCDYTSVVLPVPGVQAAIADLEWFIDNIFALFGAPSWLIQALNNLISMSTFTELENVTPSHLFINADQTLMDDGTFGSKLYHAPYLNAVLHGDHTNIVSQFQAFQLNTTMRNLLDIAPCQGTYDYGGSNFGDMQWRSDSRIDNIERIYPNGTHFGGDYNGLDYMFYHNLYYLYNGFNKDIDLSDRKVDFTLPQNISQVDQETLPDQSSPSGTQADPATIGAFETILADNTISNNADIGYRAGKTIHLTSSGGSQQFNVQNGAIFHAYIDRFTCNTNTSSGVYQRTTNNDTTQKSNIYPSASMYEQNTHGGEPQEWHVPKSVRQITPQLSTTKTDSINSIVNGVIKQTSIKLPAAEIFPNPSNGKFTVQNTFSYYTYTITDVVGNTILGGQMSSKNTDLDLSFCQPGVYLLFINGGSGNQQTKKIIIN